MKKSKLSVIFVSLICGSILFSSCIGSFTAFNGLKSWNMGIGNKFVNELVFIAFNIIPVYEVAFLADVVVINSIEFWTDENPLASVGEVKKIKGENGEYLVETLENGYTITCEDNDATMNLIFDKEKNIWSVEANDVKTELLKLNDNGTADLFLPDGNSMNVTLDAQGLTAAQQLLTTGTYYAMK